MGADEEPGDAVAEGRPGRADPAGLGQAAAELDEDRVGPDPVEPDLLAPPHDVGDEQVDRGAAEVDDRAAPAPVGGHGPIRPRAERTGKVASEEGVVVRDGPDGMHTRRTPGVNEIASMVLTPGVPGTLMRKSEREPGI